MRDDNVERAVIGALLEHPGWADDLVGICAPGDFAARGLRDVFEVVSSVADRDGAIDLVEIARRLGDRAQLAGGMAGIYELAAVTPPTRARAIAHAKLVRDMAAVRRFADEARELADAAKTAADPLAFLDDAGSRLGPLTQGQADGPRMIRGRAHDMLAVALEGRDRGIPTGFRDLDAYTLGLGRGTLTICGARPSQGKSALALAIANNVASLGIPVLFFTVEMPEAQQVLRLVAQRSGVSLGDVKRGRSSQQDRASLHAATTAVDRMPLAFDDDAGLTIGSLRSRARAFHREHCRTPIGDQPTDLLVVVDYLQLMAVERSSGSREGDIAAMSRGLKLLARELNCAVLALSQLNREVEKRTPPRPRAHDLRESGAIEQDADVILTMWRPEKYDESTKIPGLAEVIVDKQREGPTGSLWLRFDGNTTRFRDYDKPSGNNPNPTNG